MKSVFLESYNDPYYTLLRESKTNIIGTWDDHDFGINDGNIFNPVKMESRSLFLDMLNEPKQSERRINSDGIYFSMNLNDKIKVIALDNRFSSDPNKKTNLGETQEKWLKNEIESSEAEYTIIVTGISVINNERQKETFYE